MGSITPYMQQITKVFITAHVVQCQTLILNSSPFLCQLGHFYSFSKGCFKENIHLNQYCRQQRWNSDKLPCFTKCYWIDGWFIFLFPHSFQSKEQISSPTNMSLIFYRPSTPKWSQAPVKINLLKTQNAEKLFFVPTYTPYFGLLWYHRHQNLPPLVSFWHHLTTSMLAALLASPALKSRAATKPAEPCSQIWALG